MSFQWIIAELACYTYSMVVVPLYDTLGPDAIRYIINVGKFVIYYLQYFGHESKKNLRRNQ